MSGYLSAPLWQHIAVLWIYCNSFKRSFKYEDNCQAWAFQSLLSAKHIKTYINGTSEIEFRSVIRTSSVQYCYPLMLISSLEAITILYSSTSPPGALPLEVGNKVPLQNFFFQKKWNSKSSSHFLARISRPHSATLLSGLLNQTTTDTH